MVILRGVALRLRPFCHVNRRGFGAGFAIGIVWDGFSLLVTRFMQAGVVAFWISVQTGQVVQLVPMMVAPGGLSHFALMASTLTECFRLGAARSQNAL